MKRLWEWLLSLGRWPELPDDIHQSIDEQTRIRTEWIRNHRRQP